MWIENKGEVVISAWRAEFLESIASTESLPETAKKMEIPLADARLKLLEMEKRSGMKLVRPASQESGKDQLHLTLGGKNLLKKFQESAAGFEAEVAERFNRSFGK